MKKLILLLLPLLLIGCAADDFRPSKAFIVENKTEIPAGMSLVFAKNCPDGSKMMVKNLETDERIILTYQSSGWNFYRKSSILSAFIPPGKYALFSYLAPTPGLSTHVALFRTPHPFIFTVEQDSLTIYLGSILKEKAMLESNALFSKGFNEDIIQKAITCKQYLSETKQIKSATKYFYYWSGYFDEKLYDSSIKVIVFDDGDQTFDELRVMYPLLNLQGYTKSIMMRSADYIPPLDK